MIKNYNMSFYSTTPIKNTRKDHSCARCQEKILINSQAVKFAGIYEGDFCSGYICFMCDAYDKYNGPDNWEGGDLVGDDHYHAFKAGYNLALNKQN